jgi:hypothetical protein
MIPTPTPYLRFVEREQIVETTPEYSTTRLVRVLQQFWEHPDGKDAVGDMFKMKMGTWRDVPLEQEP